MVYPVDDFTKKQRIVPLFNPFHCSILFILHIILIFQSPTQVLPVHYIRLTASTCTVRLFLPCCDNHVSSASSVSAWAPYRFSSQFSCIDAGYALLRFIRPCVCKTLFPPASFYLACLFSQIIFVRFFITTLFGIPRIFAPLFPRRWIFIRMTSGFSRSFCPDQLMFLFFDGNF